MRVLVAVLALSAIAATPIQQAFQCGRVGEAGGLPAGTDMQRYTIDPVRFPDAICNDGSPAVFYFAPSTRVEDGARWLIFLQGGGGCRDGESCAERWCSTNTNFGMDKMTTSLAKASIRADGLLEPSPRNRFGTWNRVLIYYCSSDTWSGTKTSTLLSRDREYTIHFKGRFIVDAVIDTLRNASGPLHRRRAVNHDVAAAAGSTAWPDLDLATHVVFAGSSAGAGGALRNTDRVGAKLRAANPSLADYRVIIDATLGPRNDLHDWPATRLCLANPAGCSYESFHRYAWDGTLMGMQGSTGDESCVAAHPGSEWLCADETHVLWSHITTPMFIRQDLQDSLLSGNYAEAGFGTVVDFAVRVERDVRNPPVAEEPRAAPGLFVPQCTNHESFTNDGAVYNVRIEGVTFHDAVWNWWSGATPQQRIRPFTGMAGKAPECP